MIKSVCNNCKCTIGEVNIPIFCQDEYIGYKQIPKWDCLHFFFLFWKMPKKTKNTKTPHQKPPAKNPQKQNGTKQKINTKEI